MGRTTSLRRRAAIAFRCRSAGRKQPAPSGIQLRQLPTLRRLPALVRGREADGLDHGSHGHGIVHRRRPAVGDGGQRPLVIVDRDQGPFAAEARRQSAESDVPRPCRVPAVYRERWIPEGLGQENREALETHDSLVAQEAVREPGSLSHNRPTRDREPERDDEQQQLERQLPEWRVEGPGLRHLGHPGRCERRWRAQPRRGRGPTRPLAPIAERPRLRPRSQGTGPPAAASSGRPGQPATRAPGPTSRERSADGRSETAQARLPGTRGRRPRRRAGRNPPARPDQPRRTATGSATATGPGQRRRRRPGQRRGPWRSPPGRGRPGQGPHLPPGRSTRPSTSAATAQPARVSHRRCVSPAIPVTCQSIVDRRSPVNVGRPRAQRSATAKPRDTVLPRSAAEPAPLEAGARCLGWLAQPGSMAMPGRASEVAR